MAPVKRRASLDGPESKRRCQVVSKAVLRSEKLTPSCKAMLSGMAGAALMIYQEERHSYQVAMVEMVKTTLLEVENAMKRHNDELAKQVTRASEIKEERAAAVTTAEADFKSKSDAVVGADATLQECQAALKQAKEASQDVFRKHSKLSKEIGIVLEKETAVESCKVSAFLPLKDGAVSGLEMKKASNSLASICKRFDLEKLMMQAALEGLKQVPGERSSFLATSVNQMEARLDSLIRSFADELSAAEPTKQEIEAVVSAGNAAIEEASAKCSAAKKTAEEAKAAKEHSGVALKAARKDVTNYYPDMKKLMEASDGGPRDLEEFQSTVMADFAILEKRAPLAPPVEEEAAEGTGENTSVVEQ